jgi:hypothetical protein
MIQVCHDRRLFRGSLDRSRRLRILYEVRINGQPSRYFYFEDLPGRRLQATGQSLRPRDTRAVGQRVHS